jgi:hypothetical protein
MDAGREVGDVEASWRPWNPREVTRRLSGVSAPWYVAAGWAMELFTDAAARPHSDIEIAVPAPCFNEIVRALPGYEWDVAGDGRVWPHPMNAEQHFQSWLRDPATGHYHLDVFREPCSDDRWVCRRDPSITLASDELIRHTRDGVPYAAPEVALLFKAKRRREKDQADFERVVPHMDRFATARLRDWLSRVHPGHPWIAALDGS